MLGFLVIAGMGWIGGRVAGAMAGSGVDLAERALDASGFKVTYATVYGRAVALRTAADWRACVAGEEALARIAALPGLPQGHEAVLRYALFDGACRWAAQGEDTLSTLKEGFWMSGKYVAPLDPAQVTRIRERWASRREDTQAVHAFVRAVLANVQKT